MRKTNNPIPAKKLANAPNPAKKSVQPASRQALSTPTPQWANAAAALAPVIASSIRTNVERAEKKKKKKKKSSAASFLKGAAKVAATIAPSVLPVLLAGHGPSNLSAKLAGVPGVPDLSSSANMVGVASAVSVAKYATGTGVPAYKTNGHSITEVSWPGCEEVMSIGKPASGNVWQVGDVMAKISLNPASLQWTGTQIYTQAALWQRYDLEAISVMFQPAAATTQAGQMIGFCTSDPDQPFSFTGDSAIKAALAHEGSDIFNTWSVGVVTLAADAKTSDFFTQGDGSDPRLTSPGDFYLICSAPIDMTALSSLGDIVIMYRYRFKVRSDLDTAYRPGSGTVNKWLTANAQAPALGWSFFGDGTSGVYPLRTGTLSQLTPYQALPSGDRGWIIPGGTYAVEYFLSTSGTGTNATTTVLVKTDLLEPFDNKVKWIKSLDGQLLSAAGNNTVQGFGGGSQIGTVRHGTGVQYVTGHFIIRSPKAFQLVLQYKNDTQTGAWVNTVSNVTFISCYDDMFSTPAVPPMVALKSEMDDLRETNAVLSRKLDSLASLVTAHAGPDPARTVERLFQLYDAHAPSQSHHTPSGTPQ